MRRGPISRLRLAWIALGVVVVGIAGAALLLPEREAADSGVRIALPDRPDGLAPLPGERSGDDDGGPLPIVVRGEEAEAPSRAVRMPADGSNEVVITIAGEATDTADGEAGARATRTLAVPPAAPDDALTRRIEAGLVPARSPEGQTPFTAYRRLQPAGDGAAVAVIVSGLGLDPNLTARALALPPEVSLAFAPYAKDLPALIESARRAGHEVLIELPMSTPGVPEASLGPAALTTTRGAAGNAKRLDWVMTRAPAYPMATNYLGRGFSRDEDALGLVMARLSRAGVAYVDDTGFAARAARAAGVPLATTDLLVTPADGDPSPRLEGLAKAARPGDVRLAKVYASEEALAAVDRWAARLPGGVALVPASSAVSAGEAR